MPIAYFLQGHKFFGRKRNVASGGDRKGLPSNAVFLGTCDSSALVKNPRMVTIMTCDIQVGIPYEKILSCNVLCNSRLWSHGLYRQGQGPGRQGQGPGRSNEGLTVSNCHWTSKETAARRSFLAQRKSAFG